MVSGILYGSAVLAKMNPEIISGFKWGDTPEEREADKQWLRLADKCVRLAAAATLVCGIVTALLHSEILYAIIICIAPIAPILYCYVKKPKRLAKRESK